MKLLGLDEEKFGEYIKDVGNAEFIEEMKDVFNDLG